MIKFFRKIRYDLMEKNKTGKYLKYAIGEIVLVVFGILIALSMNSSYDKYKINKEEKVLIAGLIHDINQDISWLIDLKEIDSNYIASNKKLLNAFTTDSIKNDKSLLVSSIFNSTFTSGFIATKTTINEIISSGKLKHISNDSISNHVQLYYTSVETVMDIRTTNENLLHQLAISQLDFLDFNSSLQPALHKDSKLELNEFDNSFFHESTESKEVKKFANVITYKMVLMTFVDGACNHLLKEAIKLKQELIEYLETK